MADQHNIGCNCGCRIGLEVVQPESIGLQLEQFHIGFEDVPTLVISGSSLAIKQYFNVNTACEMPSVPLADITAWLAANWDNPSAPAHSSEDLKTLIVDKNGDPMETLLDIPDIYQFKSISSTEITNQLAAIWSALYN